MSKSKVFLGALATVLSVGAAIALAGNTPVRVVPYQPSTNTYGNVSGVSATTVQGINVPSGTTAPIENVRDVAGNWVYGNDNTGVGALPVCEPASSCVATEVPPPMLDVRYSLSGSDRCSYFDTAVDKRCSATRVASMTVANAVGNVGYSWQGISGSGGVVQSGSTFSITNTNALGAETATTTIRVIATDSRGVTGQIEIPINTMHVVIQVASGMNSAVLTCPGYGGDVTYTDQNGDSGTIVDENTSACGAKYIVESPYLTQLVDATCDIEDNGHGAQILYCWFPGPQFEVQGLPGDRADYSYEWDIDRGIVGCSYNACQANEVRTKGWGEARWGATVKVTHKATGFSVTKNAGAVFTMRE